MTPFTLDNRATKELHNKGIKNLEDLTSYSDGEFIRQFQIGRRHIVSLKKQLIANKLDFRGKSVFSLVKKDCAECQTLTECEIIASNSLPYEFKCDVCKNIIK